MPISVKSGTFTAPAATGNQLTSWSTGGNWPSTVTPELVIVFSTGQTAAGVGASAFSAVGAFNATQQCAFASYTDGPALSGANTIATSNSGQSARTTACIIVLSNGTPTVLSVAAAGATRFQSNGFNLNWTTVGAGTSGMIFGYVAYAGLSETWIGALRAPTAAGAQTTPVLGSGAQWDAAIFLPTWHTTGAGVLTDGTTEQTFARSGLGFAARTRSGVQQYANIYHDNDGETAMDLTLGMSTSLCLIMPANATNATATPPSASLTSFNANGTLAFNWSNVSTTTNKAFLGILLRGVNADVGVTLMPSVTTANTDVTASGLASTPKSIMLSSSGQTAEAILVASLPDNATAQWAFGVSDATTHSALNNFNQDAAVDSEARRVWSSTAAINPYKYTAASPAAGGTPTANASAGSAVVQTVASGAFTLRWNGQDATQRRIGFLSLGDSAAFVAPVVQSRSAELLAGGAPTFAFTSNVTAGNVIVVGLSAFAESLAARTVTDSQGNAYTRFGSAVSGNANAALFAASVTASGACTVTVGPNPLTADTSVVLVEYSGLQNATADASGTGAGTSATPTATTSSATTNATDLVVAVVCPDGSGSPVITAGTGFTLLQKQEDTAHEPIGLEDRIVTATGTQTAGFTYGASANWAEVIAAFKTGAAGGTQFTKSVAGTLTTAATLAKQARTSLGGTLTSSGVQTAMKLVLQALAGTLTTAGVVTKRAVRSLVGTLTSAGALARRANKALAGTLATAGILTVLKSVLKALSGTLTTSGALVNQARKSFAGTLSAAGVLTKRANKALAGTLPSASTLAKQTARALSGTLATGGAITRRVNKALGGTLTSSGALTMIKAILRAFAGTLTTAGTIAKQAQKPLAATLGTAGALTRQTRTALAGTLATAGVVTKRITRSLVGTLTSSGALTVVKAILRSFAGVLTTSGTVTRRAGKSLVGTLATSGAVSRRVAQLLVGTVTTAGVVTKRAARLFTGTVSSAGALSKQVARTLTGLLSSAGSFVGDVIGAILVRPVRVLTAPDRSLLLDVGERMLTVTAPDRTLALTAPEVD